MHFLNEYNHVSVCINNCTRVSVEQVRLQRTRHLFRDSREYEMVQRALKKMKGKTQTEVSGEMTVGNSTSSPCVM